jgi:hypothetical protein
MQELAHGADNAAIDRYLMDKMDWSVADLDEQKALPGYPATALAFCRAWLASMQRGYIANWHDEDDDLTDL